MRIISQDREIDIHYGEVVLLICETSKLVELYGVIDENKPYTLIAMFVNADSTMFSLGSFDTYGDALNEMQNIQEYYEKGMKIYRVG